jgi:hypothetical protein
MEKSTKNQDALASDRDPLTERHDWQEFRSLDTLPRKAGVKLAFLPSVVAKELVDNALDAGTQVQTGVMPDGGFFVEDDGQGIPGSDKQIARLFSINRPLTSSKHLRTPTRGALGNGLRIVAGAVLASDGGLVVKTRGRSLRLAPRDTGSTDVIGVDSWTGSGTRVEVRFGPKLPVNYDTLFFWTYWAQRLAAQGTRFKGNSSPWWYTGDSFWSLLHSYGSKPVREVVERLDGCSGRRAGKIAKDFLNRNAESFDRTEAHALLQLARAASSAVNPKRLGSVERLDDYLGYAKDRGSVEVGDAVVPYCIEVWCNVADDPFIITCVNRTPVTGQVQVVRHSKDKTRYMIHGCQMTRLFKAHRHKDFLFLVNVQCPVVPLTTDGKDPDLGAFGARLARTLEKAAGQASKKHGKGKGGGENWQYRVITDALPEAIRKASGDGRYRYSLRQLFYAIRPVFLDHFGQEPLYGTFSKIIAKYEADQGQDLPGIYRDSRGSLYHPHTKEEIPLGTLSVERYKRPRWTFNKILYCEKEGFFPILKEAKWPEQYDCALLTSKGFATRAVCDVLDLLGQTDEPLTFFCIHDADGPGTCIFEAMQSGVEMRGASDEVDIINLGLEPDEAIQLQLRPETVHRKPGKNGLPNRVPVGEYVADEWCEWLQNNRVELNAMSTPTFLTWLSDKLSTHEDSKVIPPNAELTAAFSEKVKEHLKERISANILREADLEGRISKAYDALLPEFNKRSEHLADEIEQALEERPEQSWRTAMAARAEELSKAGM